MVEMQFCRFFVTVGPFNTKSSNNLRKSITAGAQNADVVVRMPTGAGNGLQDLFNSQFGMKLGFFNTSELKIVYPPSNPYDAERNAKSAFGKIPIL